MHKLRRALTIATIATALSLPLAGGVTYAKIQSVDTSCENAGG